MANASEGTLPSLLNGAAKHIAFAVQDYTYFSARAVANLFTPPLYLADLISQMDVIGVGSLSIILLTGLSIGGVMVAQTASQFQRFGETALTGQAVALALVRELGPVITALLVAGRNASGMASELGSMVVTEQVDAMRALGTDPSRKLVTPRVVATILALPLLTAVFDLIGLVGGFILSYFELHLSPSQFWQQAIQSLVFGDLVQGLVKPLFFAFLIGTIGCYQGMRVRGGTEGVGRATTTAVVISEVLVLVVDFFIARIMLYIFSQ